MTGTLLVRTNPGSLAFMTTDAILKNIEKKYVKMVADNLRDGEELQAAAQGMVRAPVLDKKDSLTDGVLVVTNQRVIRMSKFWIQESVQAVPISKISAVQTQTGMLGLVSIEVTTSNEQLEIKVNKASAPALVEAIEKQRTALEGSVSTANEPQDPLAQIEKLAELHAKGILSDKEFSTKKSQLLDKM